MLEAVKDGKGMTTPESTYDHDWCMQWLANLGKGKIADKELGFNAGAVELTIKK